MDEDATLLAFPGLDSIDLGVSGNTHALVLTLEGETERRIPLGCEPVVVGRIPPCALVLPGGSVSRQHCRFRIIGGQTEVADLGATNGTFIDGRRITEPTILQHGAVIQIGTYALTYECRTSRELVEAEEAEHERQAASRYVQMLLPKPINDEAVSAEWLFLPCSRLGGNAFGYRFRSARSFIGFMIDVAGHGTEAAMHSVAIMNLLRQQEILGVDLSDPSAMLGLLARSFPPDQHNSLFFSCCYFSIDLETRVLRYAAAGRHPAYLRQSDTEVLELTTNVPAIGLGSPTSFPVKLTDAPVGSRLYLLSEGISESLDRFAPPGLVAKITCAATVAGVPEPSRLYHAMQHAAGLSRQDDDCTILVCQF